MTHFPTNRQNRFLLRHYTAAPVFHPLWKLRHGPSCASSNNATPPRPFGGFERKVAMTEQAFITLLAIEVSGFLTVIIMNWN